MDKDNLSVNALFEDLDKKIDISFQNQLIMATYQSVPRKYGENIRLSEIEVHLLGYIQKEPGITAKKLGEIMYRTKGTISNIISKLEKDGSLYQVVNPANRRERRLFLTEKGIEICTEHREYDRRRISDFILFLLKSCTSEEIDGFFKVLRYRTLFFDKIMKEDRNN